MQIKKRDLNSPPKSRNPKYTAFFPFYWIGNSLHGLLACLWSRIKKRFSSFRILLNRLRVVKRNPLSRGNIWISGVFYAEFGWRQFLWGKKLWRTTRFLVRLHQCIIFAVFGSSGVRATEYFYLLNSGSCCILVIS